MARTIDELRGALVKIQQVYMTEDFKYVLSEVKRIKDDKLIQDLTACGEEAIRALGFQQGIGILEMLPQLLDSTIKMKEQQMSQEMRSKLKL
jgi:hypothetical protein